MKSWQYQRLKSRRHNETVRLYVAVGKHKGKIGVYRYDAPSGKISIQFDDANDTIDIHYTNLEELDEFGQPKVLPVVDMTGREIDVGSLVCFSVSTRHSHALEIGKVLEVTRVGGLKVVTHVRNGDKVPPDRWRNNESVINDPFRSIKLPCDDQTVIMWLMQDFTEMGKQTT